MIRLSLIIPTHNRARQLLAALESVVRQDMPAGEWECVVVNNNSTDDTSTIARSHGATVTHVKLRGKGNVIRRMFADVEADIYVMVDGDATYCADDLPAHIQLMLKNRLDMVLGVRTNEDDDSGQYRRDRKSTRLNSSHT